MVAQSADHADQRVHGPLASKRGGTQLPGIARPGCHPGDSGLQSPRQRANLIAYLRSLTDNPVPLPSLPSAPNPSTGSGPAQDPYQKNSTGGG
jgi:hypothetical protein